MKNSDKYKTAKERAKAFQKWCFEQNCADGCSYKAKLNCVFAWLDLEAEEEKPLPCIWCKHETYVCEGQNYGQVRCRNCMAEGPATDSKEHAIRNYNRVAKKCMEGK